MDFDYPNKVTGKFHNWGYGPAYDLDQPVEGDYSSLPSLVFDENNINETVYLASWHIHTPADHTVQGHRSKAELHLVHASADGTERAVLGIRIDPGNSDSKFFGQIPNYIGFNSTEESSLSVPLNLNDVLAEVNNFRDFWTCKCQVKHEDQSRLLTFLLDQGSLTSPPCREGLRWFIARDVMFVSDKQMQDILRVSTYSARAEQQVWRHEVNV